MLQQLGYTYDPAGNIVRITDAAQEGAAAVIKGIAVPARRDYGYDAHYRLRQASGRVHKALLEWDLVAGGADVVKGTREISFNDGSAVERFTRNYEYDASSNLTRVRHLGTSRNWTRDFWVSATSNLVSAGAPIRPATRSPRPRPSSTPPAICARCRICGRCAGTGPGGLPQR